MTHREIQYLAQKDQPTIGIAGGGKADIIKSVGHCCAGDVMKQQLSEMGQNARL